MSRKVRNLTIVLLGLLAGWWLLLVLTSRNDNTGCGVFRGLYFLTVYVSNGERTQFFYVQGQTPAKWLWVAPANYSYDILDIEWYDKTGKIGGRVNAQTMKLSVGDRELPISKESLAELLLGAPLEQLGPKGNSGIEYLYQVLTQARDGSLPIPRHHPGYLDPPLDGNYLHLSVGPHLPHVLFVWPILWFGICWSVLRTRSPVQSSL